MNLCDFTGRPCIDSNGCQDYVGGQCAKACEERETAFAPLRTSSGGETVHHGHQITLEGPEPDCWTQIAHALRWAGLTLALIASIGLAASYFSA